MIRLPLISWLLFCLLASSAHGAPEMPSTDERGSEAQLVKSLQAINDNHLDIALNEVDNLLITNPNFKLAQLVKGDLLMARAGAIGNFGSAANASSEQIDDLRDEARVRLQRVLSRSEFSLTPRYLWKLDAGQKYALIVDTSRSTLFVYQNVNGAPHYVTDYYITIGKLGTEKISEGDQRTPLGVYFVKGVLPKRQLADLYGSGAYPLDYPNEWDRKYNRTGSGIWLHGTPSDTYSRPPRASNGCVVLANEDLEKLASYLQVGITPVIITSRMDWDTELDVRERDDLLQEVEQWRKDWASLDTSAYLEHYAQDFSSDGMDYQSWMEKKQQVNKTKSWIKVGISNLSVFSYPEQPGLAVVSFEQDYSSSNLSNRMKKRQYWIRKSDRWQIVYEGGA